jgi:YD repeat-containing protein
VGSTTSYTYDLRGLLTSITDPLQKVTSLTYSANGRPASKTDRNGITLNYTFTPTGKPASITYPDSSQVVNTFDNLDRLSTVSDSIGASAYTYDAAGHITDYTDAQGFTLSYTYDAAGNLTQITYPDASAVIYTYDAANRLTTVTNWLAEQAAYTYDQAGRLATFTNFNGIVTTYSYDAASRLTGMSSSVASYQFTLDGNGNRIHSTQTEPLSPTLSAGSTVYEYNTRRNRLLSAGLWTIVTTTRGSSQLPGPSATPSTATTA